MMRPHPPLPAVSAADLRGSSARRPRWHAIALLCLTMSVERFRCSSRGVAGTLAVQRGGTRPGDRGTRNRLSDWRGSVHADPLRRWTLRATTSLVTRRFAVCRLGRSFSGGLPGIEVSAPGRVMGDPEQHVHDVQLPQLHGPLALPTPVVGSAAVPQPPIQPVSSGHAWSPSSGHRAPARGLSRSAISACDGGVPATPASVEPGAAGGSGMPSPWPTAQGSCHVRAGPGGAGYHRHRRFQGPDRGALACEAMEVAAPGPTLTYRRLCGSDLTSLDRSWSGSGPDCMCCGGPPDDR
jgi:hypothetical protein